MLNSTTLSQLSELKKEIRTSKNLSEGIVRGTSGRYGFVTLNDGRDVYLSAEMMDRVFQGDQVEISVSENDKQQLEGKLEKLIHSPLKRIAGEYKIKGKGHFVSYHSNGYTRWVFVPPKERAKSKDGDLVTARITQHPFASGKPQAKILKNLGTETNAASIRQLTITQHQLFDSWPKEVLEEVKTLQDKKTNANIDDRVDLTDRCFVTIDAASTLDMDDAISIEANENGWDLWVAIADPASEIDEKSALYKTAAQRAQTLYFPSKPLTMLPELLATNRYSLMANEKRLAIVCKLSVNQAGQTTGYQFLRAIIESKAKLSYQHSNQLINDVALEPLSEKIDNDTLTKLLKQLVACSQKQLEYRKDNQLVLESRPDFSMRLNKQGKLESIELVERNTAHQIIEEAMVATNQCAGEFLSKHQTGIFNTHLGYKEERRNDIEGLLKETFAEMPELETKSLNGYLTVMRALQSDKQYALLMSKQQRFQNGSELSTEAKPHFGLGTAYYATVTSPIRRFQDLFNLRCIHQILQNKKTAEAKTSLVDKINQSTSNNRLAVRHMQFWLIADYMQDKIGHTFTGKIALLTNQGLGIRLVETGIEGFIAASKEDKKDPEKPFDKISFNNQRLELTWNDKPYDLEQEVMVKLVSIDSKTHKLAFEWAENKGETLAEQ